MHHFEKCGFGHKIIIDVWLFHKWWYLFLHSDVTWRIFAASLRVRMENGPCTMTTGMQA